MRCWQGFSPATNGVLARVLARAVMPPLWGRGVKTGGKPAAAPLTRFAGAQLM